MAELTPDATKAMNMRANGERPWSFHDSFDVCRNDRLLLLQHSDALSARLAEAEAAAKTWENEAERRSRRYEKAATRLAEAEALLRDIADMRVPVLPSRFMDESMAEAARAFLAADSGDERNG